jgi:hypothetical protein
VDFGDGVIERSIFSSCGNDCIDFSGSNSTISSVEVRGAGDKGVSVGEQSRVEVIDSRISDTNIGVASKDNSVVDIDGLAIHDTVTGLASYQKKPEYSGAALRAEDVVLENTEYRYYIQQGSEIVHDSRTIDCLRVPNSECQKNAPISL